MERINAPIFGIMGETFGRYLMYMVTMRDKGETISEAMYQILFKYFLEMFGLYCYAGPAIPTQTMAIKGVNVTSTPDLLLLKDNLETLAVCKIKKDFEEHCLPSSPKTCCTDENEHGELQVSHLSDRLIGENGGDLILHSKISVYERGVLGIIVQKTHVTFTHLLYLRKNDIDAVTSTNGLEENSKVIISYSRPYNYLKSDDWKELIKPLLLLGAIHKGRFK